MSRGTSVARLLLKTAGGAVAGRTVGSALRVAARGAKAAIHGAGEFGAGVAEGMGVDPGIGKAVGITAAVGTGVSGAGKVKRKTDEWRYRNGLYSGY